MSFSRVFSLSALIAFTHIFCAYAVLNAPSSLLVSSLAGVHFVAESWGLSSEIAACSLLVVGVLAIAATRVSLSDNWRLILLLPQQGLILIQGAWIIGSIIAQRFPDGYVPPADPAWFISADQIIWLLAITGHTFELWRLRDDVE